MRIMFFVLGTRYAIHFFRICHRPVHIWVFLSVFQKKTLYENQSLTGPWASGVPLAG